MTRYIIIDADTGYIFGDTGDLDGPARQESPLEAVQRLDAHIGGEPAEYEDKSISGLDHGESGYYVYRADIDGSEAVGITQDGQDQDVIQAVMDNCDLVAQFYRRTD